MKAKLFLTITKVDAVKREVSGTMTAAIPDKAKEVMDYKTSKPLFEKWSEGIQKGSRGQSLGNVREMHGPVAAGKVTEMNFLDAEERIDITAKITDDIAWGKCEDGTYTGFSIGGNYVGARWDDPDNPGCKRYTVEPVEVSVVDNPCLTAAHFTAVKADGTSEDRVFKLFTPSDDDIGTLAEEMAKAAGKAEAWLDFVVPAREKLIKDHATTSLDGADPAEVPGVGAVLPPIPVPAPAAAAASADAAAAVGALPLAGGEADPAAVNPVAAPPSPIEPPAATQGAAPPVDPTPGAQTAAKSTPEASQSTPPAAAPSFDIVQDQAWIAPDGKRFAKKADAKAHAEALKRLATEGSPLLAALAKAQAAGAPAATDDPRTVPQRMAEIAADLKRWATIIEAVNKHLMPKTVVKGLYAVSELAQALSNLRWMCESAFWEREMEGDDSTVPDQLVDGFRTLAAALIAMAQEETAEVIADFQDQGIEIETLLVGDDADIIELRAGAAVVKAAGGALEKVGARNSKKDKEAIQAIHDKATSLGAGCDAKNAAAGAGGDDPVAKLQAVTAERDALAGQIEKALPGITELGETVQKLSAGLDAAKAEIERLGNAPAPMPTLTPGTSSVDKTVDTALPSHATTAADAREVISALVKDLGADGLRSILLKDALSKPIGVVGA